MNNVVRLLLVVLAVGGSIGCSAKKCDISGTITRDGQPLHWDGERGQLLVIFIPENRQSNPDVYRADTDPEAGTYRITGIPAGKYLVAIQQFDEKFRDTLGFSLNPGATNLRQEVRENASVIDIDIPKDLPKVSVGAPALPFKKPERPRKDRTSPEKAPEGLEVGPVPREVTAGNGTIAKE